MQEFGPAVGQFEHVFGEQKPYKSSSREKANNLFVQVYQNSVKNFYGCSR